MDHEVHGLSVCTEAVSKARLHVFLPRRGRRAPHWIGSAAPHPPAKKRKGSQGKQLQFPSCLCAPLAGTWTLAQNTRNTSASAQFCSPCASGGLLAEEPGSAARKASPRCSEGSGSADAFRPKSGAQALPQGALGFGQQLCIKYGHREELPGLKASLPFEFLERFWRIPLFALTPKLFVPAPSLFFSLNQPCCHDPSARSSAPLSDLDTPCLTTLSFVLLPHAFESITITVDQRSEIDSALPRFSKT